jgi:hypothetical protein
MITDHDQLVEVQVRDIDITLDNGAVLPLTLRDEDGYELTDTEIRVTYAKTGERVTVQRSKVSWLSERTRIHREIVRPPTSDFPKA